MSTQNPAYVRRRILVTGSRDWPDDGSVEQALDALRLVEPSVIVHGACPTGADAYASRWAKGWIGYPGVGDDLVTEEAHPADWSVGRKAGPERNKRMVDLGADLCLAFIGRCTSPRCRIGGEHQSHGATGCADLAQAAGIPTTRIYAGGAS